MRVDQIPWRPQDDQGYWDRATVGRLILYRPTEKLHTMFPHMCKRGCFQAYLYASVELARRSPGGYVEDYPSIDALMLQCLLNEYGGDDEARS